MSLEDGDFYFFKGTSPGQLRLRYGGWVSFLQRKEGRVPNNESLVNSLPQVELVAQKVSFQRWNWDQVSRVSRVETVGGGLLCSLKSAERLAESTLPSWQYELGLSLSFWNLYFLDRESGTQV